MSRLGSLYIKHGSPDGELSGCCEVAEWAADYIEVLEAELAVLKKPKDKVIYAWRNPMNGVVISNDKKQQIGVGRGYPNFSEPLYR